MEWAKNFTWTWSIATSSLNGRDMEYGNGADMEFGNDMGMENGSEKQWNGTRGRRRRKEGDLMET